MNIGIVCEGPTDYPAIEYFVGTSLKNRGIIPVFHGLAPEMDKTRPDGGWGLVMTWLTKYPPQARVQQFFGGGLFGGGLQTAPLDAILFQLDTDILDDDSFCNYVNQHFSLALSSPLAPNDRAAQVRMVLTAAMGCETLTQVDASKHVIFPAVESTETWCVAVFAGQPGNSELLRGAQLTNAFMRALEVSESREPQQTYAKIDKTLHRRQRFCEKHAHNSNRILADCGQFVQALEALAELNP